MEKQTGSSLWISCPNCGKGREVLLYHYPPYSPVNSSENCLKPEESQYLVLLRKLDEMTDTLHSVAVWLSVPTRHESPNT